MILARAEIDALARGAESDPFALLGLQRAPRGTILRAFRPHARTLEVIDARGVSLGMLERIHPAGIFAREFARSERFRYRLRETNGAGEVVEFEDPYAFGPLLGDTDIWLIGEGTHRRLYDVLGAHVRDHEGSLGTSFAVWAPSAKRASVVGEFNGWDGRMHPMRKRHECGVWELFIPSDLTGSRYKYEFLDADGTLLPLRADPFANESELRPATASVVAAPSRHVWRDDAWLARRSAERDQPLSIYEVHLGSWRRHGENGERYLTYADLANELIPYARDLGYTHLELLPVTEFPFDGSWGYQTLGMFAPTRRFGTPDDFRAFVEAAHAAGLGVILDWVPGHFPTDAHGLARFDGTHLYEHEDPRKGFHHGWGTCAYNHGRTEVKNFLIASALYWLREFHLDGLRVDAVSSMIYLDYERAPGAWMPNHLGGAENFESTAFLRELNDVVAAEVEGAVTIAEEATAWPKVTHPTRDGGLGFTYKWNMGWMHDTLRLFARDPLYRGYHLDESTFGLTYAFDEAHVLPFSHDEVVHLKRSLLGRMPGSDDARFASLRALFAYQYAHPGKKLLFMGAEFGQAAEWSEERSLDWHLLADPRRRGVQRLVHDLNALYRATPALWRCDDGWAGFTWISCDDTSSAVLAFERHDPKSGDVLVFAINLSGVGYERYRIGVPHGGRWREVLNTDAAAYGGGGRGNYGITTAREIAQHGRSHALELYLPPQSALALVPDVPA
jgi:1,4-alpha-glucan branching enzyme